MTWADDVFGDGFLGRLWEEREAGYIRTQCHPEDQCLEIWNYTEKCVFDRHWNPTTLATRGLITYLHDGLELEIVSRPFDKFFNYGEINAASIAWLDQVEVTDKIDGSLGISYLDPDGKISIATRGSFTSDQALHATEFLRRNPEYAEWMAKVDQTEFTVLVEIVYPENRIVVDYGAEDELVLLGIRDVRTGQTVGPQYLNSYPGRRAQTFEYATMADALAAPPRPGQEGLVVRKARTEDRVKLKQEDYILLHRVVTNLNERAVWEVLRTGQDSDAWIAQLPDEFHDWAKDVRRELLKKYQEIHQTIDDEFGTVHMLAESNSRDAQVPFRKAFAGYAQTTPNAGFLFSKLDGKDYSAKVWDLIKPAANQGPHGKKDESGES
jgi:RNA ligase